MDTPTTVEISMDYYKQVLVIRQKYPDGKGGLCKTRKGKEIAQGAHGSLGVVLRNKFLLREDHGDLDPVQGAWRSFKETPRPEAATHLAIPLTEPLKAWILDLFTKIVVGVDTEEELIELQKKADEAGIANVLIEDSGLTEFHGVKTKTVLAIGPDTAEKIDKITSHLKLL